MLIYHILHSMFYPLQINGIKQMINNVKYESLNNEINIDLNDYLKNTYYKEIDNILITPNGIFLLFNLLLDGQVFGNNTGDKWIQRYNHKQIYLPNPIKYNLNLINELNSKLNLDYNINNLVVFINNNANNTISNSICNLKDLESYINNFNSTIIFTNYQIDFLYNKIKESINK